MFTDISEESTASIFRVEGARQVNNQHQADGKQRILELYR
jgi:hypothetical protein